MAAVIKLAIFLLFVVIGYFRGRHNERVHLRSLKEEELTVKNILVFATRYPQRIPNTRQDPMLVAGSAVIGSDYFRFLLGGLRKFVGGNYSVYEDLIHRGRRQAIVRMKQAAKAQNASMIFNVKFETTQISNPRQGEAPQVEVLAYGTAFVTAQDDVACSVAHYQPVIIPEVETKQFQTFKNRYAQISLGVTLLLAVYCISESVLANKIPLLRYVNGAPWRVFFCVASLLAITAIFRSKRSNLPISDKVLLTVLFVPMMAAALYFIALRLNTLTASPLQDVSYVLQEDISLKPTKLLFPVIRFDDVNDDYWRAQKTGMVISVPLQKGILGFYQYDADALSKKYREFYQSRHQIHGQK
ncbi:YbjQ family protein [Moraxellaceae bacterium AER2_44_116]|nr:heavy metal-binding domain-containing protein [Moraxellaceae bacterium]TQC95502.1 YbjQ family protein [Moraxellaceae bacterium AER2_44_116]